MAENRDGLQKIAFGSLENGKKTEIGLADGRWVEPAGLGVESLWRLESFKVLTKENLVAKANPEAGGVL